MTVEIKLPRRNILLGAAAFPFMGTTASLVTSNAHAAGHSETKENVPYSHYKVGDFIVTTLLAGSSNGSEPQKTFGMNVSADEFNKASADNLISSDAFKAFFTPTVVDTGSEIVLFDAGLGGEIPGVVNALEGAGYKPEDITHLVITHMHPDHIGGLMMGGKPTFPNAKVFTGSIEYNFWSKMEEGNRVGDMVAKMVTPMADKIIFLDDGGSVTSGITASAAFGHTPGHMTYMLESNGQQLLIAADFANHYVWSLAHPDWEVRFDADKVAAAASRRKVLAMLASEKIPFIGYHMPFPAVGYVALRGDGFHYVPESYQLAL
jgi:glyoxylase-like metal-dependent hydrolase (beta-lactamase superfamily II)